MNSSVDVDNAFRSFTTILTASGLRPALAFLLELTSYRFIAIFRFKDGKSTAVVFYDRENPQITTSAEVPETATYCTFVRDSRGVFKTADSLNDPRLDTHAARETVLAYCGVPIMTPEGEVLGALCHYDVVQRDPEQINLELMLRVAGIIEQTGVMPAYPARPA